MASVLEAKNVTKIFGGGFLSREEENVAVNDISMSLDNVVAVAAIAREDTALLVFGLVLAIVLMAFFATIIMRVMTKFPWLSWIGLIFLVYLTIKMLVDGWFELLHIL